MFALPLIVGAVFDSKSVTFVYLCGQLVLWALFQIIAVPCINCRTDFSTLVWIYTGIVIAAAGVGIYTILKKAKSKKNADDKTEMGTRGFRVSPFLIIALLIIAYQCCIYIFGLHSDLDDSRWIAEANDALVKNKMLLHNPATGVYIGRFMGEMVKDVFSPWSMYLAVLSRWTGIRAVVIAHTVYPPILLGMSYAAYYEIGSQLFKGKHERGIFLLMVSVINLFMAGNTYTQSVFSLTRIWQGKAVVAAVIIPVILMAVLRTDWKLLILTGVSCCLLSGMGIAIGLLMNGVYGLYLLVCTVVRKVRSRKLTNRCSWKTCLIGGCLWLLSIMPPLVYGMGYLRLKG